MPQIFVPFDTYDPSREHGSDLLRCENVLPIWNGLHSMPKTTSRAAVAGERFTSSYHDKTGGLQYFGSIGNLFSIDAAAPPALVDVSGAAYAAGGYPWSFATFGSDVWAFNYADPPQRRTAGAGNFANGIVSTFVPIARCCAVVREYMVTGGLNQALRFPDELCWSDANDATWFDPKTGTRATSLAGSKRILTGGGGITYIAGGEYGIIWKDRSMHALQFTGGNDVWRLDAISETVGTEFPASIVLCADGVRRWWGGTSFYEQSGLSAPTRLGGEEISSLMLDSAAHINGMSFQGLSASLVPADYNTLIFGAEDHNRGVVYWFYTGTSDTVSVGANRGLAYNYRTNQWTSLVFTSLNVTCANTSFFRSANFDTHGEVVLGRMSGADAVFSTIDASTNHAITLATQRFAIGQGEASSLARKFLLRGVQPIVTLNQSTFGTDYKLATMPTTLTITAIAANDPSFQAQTDALGTQISPRSESRSMLTANDFGWLSYALEGRSLLLELFVPETATAIRGLRGVWLDYDLVG